MGIKRQFEEMIAKKLLIVGLCILLLPIVFAIEGSIEMGKIDPQILLELEAEPRIKVIVTLDDQ